MLSKRPWRLPGGNNELVAVRSGGRGLGGEDSGAPSTGTGDVTGLPPIRMSHPSQDSRYGICPSKNRTAGNKRSAGENQSPPSVTGR